MVEKRRGLGRGLGALISGSPSGNEDNRIEVDKSSSVTGEVSTTAPAAALESRHKKSSSAKETPVSVHDPEALTPSTTKTVPVSRETSLKDRQTTSSKPNVTASSDSSSTVNVASSMEASAPSPKSRAAETSSKTENKAPISKGSSSQRQSRPVDMFFTPGRRENETGDHPSSETVSERRNAATRSRRLAVPDVLGKVRNPRDEMNDSPENSSAGSTDASNEATPVTEKETDSLPSVASHPVADIGDVPRETLVAVPGATFAELNVVSIHPNRKQPRTLFDDEDMAELVHSIREVGLLQPIVVRPSDEGGDQTFELVMGERRWRAVQQAGLATIPAIVRETADTALLRDALLENLHRSQLNPLEEAAAYQQLMQEFDCTQDELSARIGRSRPQISNTIRLMRLPALVQRRVAAGVLSAGHARALLGLEDVADMERLAQRIVNEGLSVRATEEIVSMNDGLRRKTREKAPRSTARHERLDYLASSLSNHLETNVKISLGAKKGRVSIEFGSVEDLNRIMGVIAPSAEQ